MNRITAESVLAKTTDSFLNSVPCCAINDEQEVFVTIRITTIETDEAGRVREREVATHRQGFIAKEAQEQHDLCVAKEQAEILRREHDRRNWAVVLR